MNKDAAFTDEEAKAELNKLVAQCVPVDDEVPH